MKCIRYPDGKVDRLDDPAARKEVKLAGARYISKNEWKRETGSTEKVTGRPPK